MKRKRTYQAIRVQQVRVAELLPLLAVGCIVALDVAKQRFVVALATLAGEVVKLFRFEHPTETEEFLRVVAELRAGSEAGKVSAAMEPTGTYGDAIRHQLVKAGVEVSMVSPKRTHDSQELFDNVHSLHDPKSATLVAKLHAMGLSTRWKAPEPTRVRLRALVDLRQHEQRQGERCYGRLEAVLSRHWPEHGQWMDVREQKSALRLLTRYPSPASVEADPDGVRALLREASRARLSAEAIEGVIAVAGATLGVPMVPEEERMVQMLAMQALEAGERAERLERDMQAIGKEDEVFARLHRWMGPVTAAVMVTMCDPRQYATARQMEKACGLNLREKSSGEQKGRLSITKRGPGLARQMLYLFALRMIQQSCVVRAWYMRRRGYTEESKQRAIIAVMRKLARAAFHVARGDTFDASKLFDVRRLELGSPDAVAVKETSTAAPTSATTLKETSTAAPTSATTPKETSAAAPKETNAAVAPTSAAARDTMSLEAVKAAASAVADACKKAGGKKVIARTTPRPIARGKKHARTITNAHAST